MNEQPRGLFRFTFREFDIWCKGRPDGEKWELLEGRIVMSPLPNGRHQQIVTNITATLYQAAVEQGAKWMPYAGLNVHVPEVPDSSPQPDVIASVFTGRDFVYENQPIAVFEILSKGSKSRDQVIKRRIYRGMPTIQHYVIVAQDTVSVIHFNRANGWKAKPVADAEAVVDLTALDVVLPLRAIYRFTGLVIAGLVPRLSG